jgi:hypothetical protein
VTLSGSQDGFVDKRITGFHEVHHP